MGVIQIPAPANGFQQGQQMIGSVMDMMMTMKNMQTSKMQQESLLAQAQFNALKNPLELQSAQIAVTKAGLQTKIDTDTIESNARKKLYEEATNPSKIIQEQSKATQDAIAAAD